MNKISKYSDIGVLALIAYLIIVAIIQHFTDGYRLSLNFYLGLLAWLFAIYFKVINRSTRYVVFVLLLFAVFNIISFTAFITSFGRVIYLYESDSFLIASLGLNPLILLVLIAYFCLNRNIGIAFYERMFYGSNKEHLEKLDKAVTFYYNKFNAYTEEELTDVFKMYKDYPLEAQQALQKIHGERNLALLTF